ncbi:MAG: CBS domain-containing protein [Woeseiaceae bacterium]|nr:CBS domain-containing protein [Woeseiaceae bacterium]
MSLKSSLVRDYMAGQLITFKPDMEIMDAIHELVQQRVAGAPVVDDKGDLVGMLSELDCMKVALNAGYYGDWGGPVADYMTTAVESVDSEMNIVDLAQKFLDSGYRRFPVLRNNRLVGQISRRDALRALSELAVG